MALIQLEFSIRSRHLNMLMDLDRGRSNERHILHYLDTGQHYEPDISSLMMRLVEEDDVVVDVGANAGFFTVLLATLVGPKGRVLSFEPEPNTAERLKNNIAVNAFENVTVIAQPASAAPGEVTLFLNSDDVGGNALWNVGTFPGNVKSAGDPKPVAMQATTIDDEIARRQLPPPKLIKIDTEGAELEVLKGCRNLLAGRQVPFVIAEYHPFGLDKMGGSGRALQAFMDGFGYSCFGTYYDGDMPRLIPAASNIDAPCIINLLFSTPEHLGRAWPTVYHHPATKQPKTA